MNGRRDRAVHRSIVEYAGIHKTIQLASELDRLAPVFAILPDMGGTGISTSQGKPKTKSSIRLGNKRRLLIMSMMVWVCLTILLLMMMTTTMFLPGVITETKTEARTICLVRPMMTRTDSEFLDKK